MNDEGCRRMTTKSFRRLAINEYGAVTVFAAVVLSSLLLFFAILIDYARIAVFHKLGESATRAGIRSALSAYDAFLYTHYGLFGRGGTDGEQLFKEVVEKNAAGSYSSIMEQSNGMKLVRMELEQATLNSSAFLGSHSVFKRQVLEEMKYKAPVDFTLDIVSKFVPIAGAMGEAAATIDLLEKLRQLYERREAHLTAALELQEKAAGAAAASGLDAAIPGRSAAQANSGHTALAVAAESAAYADLVARPAEDNQGSVEHSSEASAYEEKARAVAAEVRRLASELQARHEPLLQQSLRELEAANSLNEQMKGVLRAAEASARAGGYAEVERSRTMQEAGDVSSPHASEEIEKLRQSADAMLREQSWFAAYRQELGEQGSRLAAIHSAAGSFQSASLALLAAPGSSSAQLQLTDAAFHLRAVYLTYEDMYGKPGKVLESRRQSIEQGDLQARISEQKSRADNRWSQARNLLNGFGALPREEEHQRQFAQAKEQLEQNLRFNQAQEEAEDSAYIVQTGDAHTAAASAAMQSDSLFGGMADMLTRARDSVYTAEYAAARFPYFAPQQLSELFLGGEISELSHALSFQNQELEYVLYGLHDPVGNLAAAYGQLFAVRLAIRTMEGLIESRSLGHPLVVLTAALVYGLEKTMEDMLAFAERGAAPLSKYVSVELAYVDYMRLFLLANPVKESNRLARMIAVIEQNSGARLAEVPSGITGESRLSMKLWFVPGLTGLLGRLGILEGKVVGSRYEAVQTLGSSY